MDSLAGMRDSEEGTGSLGRLGIAVFTTGPDGKVTRWHGHCESLYGWTAEEAAGRSIIDLILPGELPRATKEGLERLANGESRLCEVVLQRRDGSTFPAAVRGSPLYSRDGSLTGYVGVSIDLTEPRRIESALKERESQLAELERATGVGFWELDAASDEITFSDGLLRTFGVRPEDVPRKLRDVVEAFVHPDDRDGANATHGEARDSGAPYVLEFRLLLPGGRLRHVISVGEAVAGDSGAVVKLRGTLHDVTEQKRAEHELRRADATRRELVRHLVNAQEQERRRIAYEIHDESIQALAAVGLELEALRRRLPAADDDLEPLRRVEERLREATTGLRQLLLGLNPPELQRSGVIAALEAYLNEMADGWGLHWRLDSTLAAEPCAETGGVLYRICLEALSNVARHARAETVEILIEPRDRGIHALVRDDGEGFSLEAPQRSGHMGLVAMRERAELSGGWLRLDSEPGAGTTVEFWIPAN